MPSFFILNSHTKSKKYYITFLEGIKGKKQKVQILNTINNIIDNIFMY